MKKKYEMPRMISEEFNIKNHIAAVCSSFNTLSKYPKAADILCDHDKKDYIKDHIHDNIGGVIFLDSNRGCAKKINNQSELNNHMNSLDVTCYHKNIVHTVGFRGGFSNFTVYVASNS